MSATSQERQRMIALFYLLLRDHLPAGSMEDLVALVERGPEAPVILELGDLAVYARKLTSRLFGS
jgi:hypothetical protein